MARNSDLAVIVYFYRIYCPEKAIYTAISRTSKYLQGLAPLVNFEKKLIGS